MGVGALSMHQIKKLTSDQRKDAEIYLIIHELVKFMEYLNFLYPEGLLEGMGYTHVRHG